MHSYIVKHGSCRPVQDETVTHTLDFSLSAAACRESISAVAAAGCCALLLLSEDEAATAAPTCSRPQAVRHTTPHTTEYVVTTEFTSHMQDINPGATACQAVLVQLSYRVLNRSRCIGRHCHCT